MSIFEDLRRAFREAADNFKEELNRDEVGGTVDRLLKGMVSEVTDAKANLASLEDQLGKTREQAAAEAREVATCLRREQMAKDIGDAETESVARDYARRHLQRQEVLEQKAEALRREVELRRSEIEEMLEKVKEARERRQELAAQAGRAGARDSLGGAADLFDELDRMAARIEGEEHAGEAAADLGAMGDDWDDLRVDPYAPPRRPQVDLDARLAELKRRMGRDD